MTLPVPNPPNSPNEKWQPTRWGVDPRTERLRQLLLAEGVEERLALGFSMAMDELLKIRSYEKRELLEEFARWANTHTHPGGVLAAGWHDLATAPTRNRGLLTGWLPGYGLLLAGGGDPTAGVSYVDTTGWLFDGSTYTSIAALSAGRAHAACAVIGGKLYAAGGLTGSGLGVTTLWIYDPVTDAWTTGASLPAAKYGAQGATDGTYLYVIGGQNTTTYRYDPVWDSWTTLTNYPTLFCSDMSTVYDGAGGIICFGGVYTSASANVYRYDIAGDSFTAKTAIPGGIGRFGQAGRLMSDGRILLAGGATGTGGWDTAPYATDSGWYDPVGDSWTTEVAPNGIHYYWPAHGVNDSGYLILVAGDYVQSEMFVPA